MSLVSHPNDSESSYGLMKKVCFAQTNLKEVRLNSEELGGTVTEWKQSHRLVSFKENVIPLHVQENVNSFVLS